MYKVIIAPQFSRVRTFSEGLAAVRVDDSLDGKWGYIDRTGQFVIDSTYDSAESFEEGLALVSIDSKYGFINRAGKFIIQPEFDDAQIFSEGLARVQVGEIIDEAKIGYIDTRGNWKFELNKDFGAPYESYLFKEGLAAQHVDKGWGFVDKTGEWAIKPQYEDVSSFSMGLAMAKSDDGCGFIDRSGTWIIKPRFEEGKGFSEGLAAVMVGGKWGFIDQSGRFITSPQFDFTSGYHEGVAIVAISNDGKPVEPNEVLGGYLNQAKWGLINQAGKFILDRFFDGLEFVGGGRAIVKVENKWGLIDFNGNITTHPQFNFISNFHEGIALVEDTQSRKYGYIA